MSHRLPAPGTPARAPRLDNVLVLAADMLGLGLDAYRASGRSSCSLSGLAGFETRPSAELSAGCSSRAICRALLPDPSLGDLLADGRAVSALDAMTREEMARLGCESGPRRKTSLFVNTLVPEAILLSPRSWSDAGARAPRAGHHIDLLATRDGSTWIFDAKFKPYATMFEAYLRDLGARCNGG